MNTVTEEKLVPTNFDENDDRKIEYNLYVIRDRVAEKFGPIFEAANYKIALRSIYKAIKTDLEDYDLYSVGFRYSDGSVTGFKPHFVCTLEKADE